MSKCEKCGKDVGLVTNVVFNNYPTQGFPYDTKKVVCKKCKEKFYRYITKKYNEFFRSESESK